MPLDDAKIRNLENRITHVEQDSKEDRRLREENNVLLKAIHYAVAGDSLKSVDGLVQTVKANSLDITRNSKILQDHDAVLMDIGEKVDNHPLAIREEMARQLKVFFGDYEGKMADLLQTIEELKSAPYKDHKSNVLLLKVAALTVMGNLFLLVVTHLPELLNALKGGR